MVTVTEKIERWKTTAEIFLKENIRVYIKDLGNEYYFADILFVGDRTITIQCFAPERKLGNKYTLWWNLIEEFEQYVGEGK